MELEKIFHMIRLHLIAAGLQNKTEKEAVDHLLREGFSRVAIEAERRGETFEDFLRGLFQSYVADAAWNALRARAQARALGLSEKEVSLAGWVQIQHLVEADQALARAIIQYFEGQEQPARRKRPCKKPLLASVK